MSTIRRLGVEVYGNVSGFVAAMNRVDATTTRTAAGFRRGAQDAGLMNRQAMALGTTMRYALAGGLVFGITGALGTLAEFKRSLGEIDSLAAQWKDGHLKGLGGTLEDVGSSAILTSNKVGIATSDVEAYMTRFWSAFEAPRGMQSSDFLGEARGFVDTVSKLQVVLGAEAGDPQALAGGIAGYVNQIPGGREHPAETSKRVAGLVSLLTQQTPTITGRNIALDIGRIGAAQAQANITPEQAFAIWTVAGRAGGSASVIGRGLAQLLGTSLLNPKTPQEKQAYTSIGLPTDPSTLRQMGGMRVLAQMLDRVGSGGSVKNLSVLTNEELAPDEALAAAGASNIDLTKIYQLFGRQESARQFVNLLGQGGVTALRDFIGEAEHGSKVFEERARLVEAQMGLQRTHQAWLNLNMSLLRGLEPGISFAIGKPLGFVSNEAAKHTTTTAVAVDAALGIAAASALAKLGVFSKLGVASKFGGRFGRFLEGASSAQRAAIGGAVTAEELPAAIAGGATDGSRGNPFWVIIAPLSWTLGGPGGAGGPSAPGGGGGKMPPIIPVGLRGVIGKTLGVGTAYLAANELTGWRYSGSKGWGNLGHDIGGIGGWVGGGGGGMHPDLAAAIQYRRSTPNWQVQVGGEANVTVQGDLRDAHGNIVGTIRKKGVPVKLWGANQFPTTKGKPGSRKAGGK